MVYMKGLKNRRVIFLLTKKKQFENKKRESMEKCV